MLRVLRSAVPLLAILTAPGLMQAQQARSAPAPQLVLPGSNSGSGTGSVTGVAVAPGSAATWAVTGSLDGTVVIWDLASAFPLRRITSDGGGVSTLMLHPQGRAVLASYFDGTVRFLDPRTGSLLAQPSALARHNPLAWSPDGKTLYTGSGRLYAFRGDPSTFQTPLWTASVYEGGSYASIVRAAPDGKSLFTAPNSGGEIAILNPENGQTTGKIQTPSKTITDIALDPTGRTLAAATPDGVFLWDLTKTGSPRLTLSPAKAAFELLFSSDNSRLVARSPEEALVYDALSGTLLQTIAVGYGQHNSMALAGPLLVTGSHTGTIAVWDLKTGTLLRRGGNRLAAIQSAHFGPDGQLALAGVAGIEQPDDSFSATLGKVWDFSTETASSLVYEGHVLSVVGNRFLQNGKLLATSSFDGTRLWDAATLAPRASIPHQSLSTAASDDGRFLVWQTLGTPAAPGMVLTIHDLAEGKTRGEVHLPAETLQQLVAFQPAGELIASVAQPAFSVPGQDLWVNLIDLQKPSVRDRLKIPIENAPPVTSMRFDPGGTALWLGLVDGRIVEYDYERHTIAAILAGHTKAVTAMADSPDGKRWASAGVDGQVLLWQPGQPRPEQILKPVSGYANLLQFDPRGQLMLMGCDDGTIELWDWQTNRLLLTVAFLDAQRWVAATPEGLFDGSDGAWESLAWRFGNDTFQNAPVEQFFNEFFYPGLVGAVLAGQRPAPRLVLDNVDRHAPDVQMEVKAAQPGFADVRIRLREGRPHGGLRDVRLFRNGILVHAWRGAIATADLPYRVPLGAGENRLEAYAFNNANIRSLTAHAVAHGPAAAPARKAYLLAIGVNRYADPANNLEYARADAEEFLHQVHTHLKGLGQFDGIEEKLLPDNDATRNNIQAALADLARKAGPDDAVLIFYAGHGMARKGRFYLLPHDADFSAAGPPPRSLSDDDLSSLLEPVNAGHLVLILDTCQSATTLDNAEWRRGPLNSRGLAQLAYEKGMYLLAAAQNDGVAKERREFGHGLLTYALMKEGLDPDFSDVAPQDGLVTVNEWLSYAGHRVPELDAADQLPSRGVKSSLPRLEPVQQPRVYYRREWATPALIVAGHAGQQ